MIGCSLFKTSIRRVYLRTMKKIISQRSAALGLLAILSAVILFHFLVLTGLIPFEIVWGGKLESQGQMLIFEAVSIGLNGLMVFMVLLRGGWLRWPVHPRFVRGAMWAMCGLFVLNTFGNLLSDNAFEKVVFTPMTLVLAFLCWRLALKSDSRIHLQSGEIR